MENRGNHSDLVLEDLVEKVENDDTRAYIHNRVIAEMKWYSKKSAEYKREYQTWMTASIVSGALIPVFVIFTEGSAWIRALIAALATWLTCCNLFLSLRNSKNLWLTYQNIRVSLLQNLYYYLNHAGKFSNGTQEEKDSLLIEICEAEISRENVDQYVKPSD